MGIGLLLDAFDGVQNYVTPIVGWDDNAEEKGYRFNNGDEF